MNCTTVCYVNAATGNDLADGSTPGTAKKTIQAGIDAVTASGTVNVAAGTYNEDVKIDNSGHSRARCHPSRGGR